MSLEQVLSSCAWLIKSQVTEICLKCGNDDFWVSLLLPLDAQNLTQQSNLQLLYLDKTY